MEPDFEKLSPIANNILHLLGESSLRCSEVVWTLAAVLKAVDEEAQRQEGPPINDGDILNIFKEAFEQVGVALTPQH